MSLKRKFIKTLTLGLAVVASNVGMAQDEDDKGPKFTIGSKAPAIDIEHWVSDNDGKFEHVTELKSDKVYVIEFWATWCGPCIASMPHLSETQKKYADKGVQLISVSDEDLETVEEFLERDVKGKDMTYAELTKGYCLTADPDKSVHKAYFEAAGQRGIPCAFIVGKEGYVEWIGHPMQMDKPLEQVVEGKWDREKYAVEMKEQQKKQAEMMKAQRTLGPKMQEVQQLLQDGDHEEGLKRLDEIIADEKFEQFKPMLENARMQMTIQFVGGAEGAKALKKFAEQNKNNAMMLNQVAWNLYEKHVQEPVGEEMLKAAAEAAELGVKAEPENGYVLDTLAHLLNELGDIDRAIEMQEKAIKFYDGEDKEQLEEFLKELKAKKKK